MSIISYQVRDNSHEQYDSNVIEIDAIPICSKVHLCHFSYSLMSLTKSELVDYNVIEINYLGKHIIE